MNTLEVLVAARELISAPERWTTGVLARNSKRHTVEPDDPSAICWCGMGAVVAVTPPQERVLAPNDHWMYLPALNRLRATVGYDIFPDFNDSHDHAQVLAAFDAAIEAQRNAA